MAARAVILPPRPRLRARPTARTSLRVALALLAMLAGACRPGGGEAGRTFLERSTRALRDVRTLRYRVTMRAPVTDVWGAPMQAEAMDIEYVVGDGGLVRTLLPHEGGLPDEIVCSGDGCWWRVGEHPWSSAGDQAPVEFTSFLEERQAALAQATVLGTEHDDAGHVVVSWEAQVAGSTTVSGRSWLDTSTFLPAREVYTVADGDEATLLELEFEYLEYDRPMTIVTPVPATVTPMPTIAVGDVAPVPVVEDDAAPLGLLFVPEPPGGYPGVVVLGDAARQATMPSDLARGLAARGYVALTYCYTTCPGAPSSLAEVDAAGVAEAINYLRRHPAVAGDSVGLVGIGRGAELALVATALGIEAQAVVAISSPARVGPGAEPGREAWLYEGEPTGMLEIPVETIGAPVLVIHGQNDARHPVTGAYRMAERRWAAGQECELAIYPSGDEWLYRSSPDAVARTVDFLDRTLYYLR